VGVLQAHEAPFDPREVLDMKDNRQESSQSRLDEVVASAIKNREERDKDYRARALKLYPWVCGRCGREFTRENLRELTVHHRDHDHDHNPLDGSNWELLCIYCHDNEHQRYLEQVRGYTASTPARAESKAATHQPFAQLKGLLGTTDRD
jgi:5-methylcytosine-specific restriction endonuclease McrA